MRFNQSLYQPEIVYADQKVAIRTGFEASKCIFITSPEVLNDEQLRFDSMSDGSYVVGVDYGLSPIDGEFRYKLWFFYPFTAEIHVWYVDQNGVRREAESLNPVDQLEFLHARPADIGCIARLAMLLPDLSDDFMSKANLALLQTASSATLCAAELAITMLDRSSHPSLRDAALRCVEHFASNFLSVAGDYKNGRCFSSRCRPLIKRMADRGYNISRTSYDLLNLDIVSRHYNTTDFGTPLPKSNLLIDHDYSINRFEFTYRFGIPNSLTVGGNMGRLNEVRMTAPVRQLQEIVSVFNLNDDVTDFARDQFGVAVGDKQSLSIQIGDVCEDYVSLAYSTRSDYSHVTTIPDPYFTESRAFDQMRRAINEQWIDWANRNDIVFWRGQSTGAENITLASVDILPRYKLCAFANRIDGTDCKLVSIVQAKAGHADQIKDYFLQTNVLGGWVPEVEMIRYKYLIDIDGNVNSWGCFTKFLMGSCVLKVESQEGWRQWYYPDLKPWEHFVPIRADLSDLVERISWCRDNQERCARIARASRKLTLELGYASEMKGAAKRILSAISGIPVG